MDIGQVEDMAYVYILKSKKNGTYYIGSTNDILRREKEHLEGKSKYTSHLLPLVTVFIQEFIDLTSARKAEKWLKKLKSRKIIEQIILDGKINSAAVVQR